jgi:adenosylhomocysteine nucleosidase
MKKPKHGKPSVLVLVLVCAKDEWKVLRSRQFYGPGPAQQAPFQFFEAKVKVGGGESVGVIFLHSGCGKVAASAAVQYGLDKWRPKLVINLGTCGGFEGLAEEHEILIVKRAGIYDMFEIDGKEIQRKPCVLALAPSSLLRKPWPSGARLACVATGDQDLDSRTIPVLRLPPFNAIAADWESAAIAWVCARNNTCCLILRGVSDTVRNRPSSNPVIKAGTKVVMTKLLEDLPMWLERVGAVIFGEKNGRRKHR